MFSLFCATLLLASSWALPLTQTYSYSPAVGLGSGTNYATKGEGPITGIRVWEFSNSYIPGFQLRYGDTWSDLIGRKGDTEQELQLYNGETIVQVSGKFYSGNYLYQVFFVTSKGRFLMSGQPIYTSFNFYPKYNGTELVSLSGRFDGSGITSIGAHWGIASDISSATNISIKAIK